MVLDYVAAAVGIGQMDGVVGPDESLAVVMRTTTIVSRPSMKGEEMTASKNDFHRVFLPDKVKLQSI